MFRHLLKLAWNRKRANALLMVEVFACFLVVLAVTTAAFAMAARYRVPTGHRSTDVWAVEMQPLGPRTQLGTPADTRFTRTLVDVVRAAESDPRVRAVAVASLAPYSSSNDVVTWTHEGTPLEATSAFASDEFDDVLGLEIERGRWFDDSDDGRSWLPVVIDRALAERAFGSADPIGRTISTPREGPAWRVVGVVRHYRQNGEFSAPSGAVFQRTTPATASPFAARTMLLAVEPGTPAQFEESLVTRVQPIAREWQFSVRRLERSRADYMRTRLVPLAIGAVVAVFLVLTVLLGIFGVLWQNVTRRTAEFGLRRALGASAADIHRQVVLEALLMAGFGLAGGVAVGFQLPWIEPLSFVPRSLLMAAIAVSVLVLVALTGACGLYPGWTATRVEPADALHHE